MSKQHRLILDPVTASFFPPSKFDEYKKPVSAAFNSMLRPSQRAATHFNSNEAVGLTINKPLAFQLLNSRPEFFGPEFMPMAETFDSKGNFDYQEFENFFGTDNVENPYHVINRRPVNSTVVENYGDLVELQSQLALKPNRQDIIKNSAFVQSLEEYHSATITVAPLFNGIRIRGDRGTAIENGILFEEYHGISFRVEELRVTAMSVAVEFGADYLTVEFQYNTAQIQIVDVHTRLQPETVDALRFIFNYLTSAQ